MAELPQKGSLFAKDPSPSSEVFETLLEGGAFKLERISSYGHSTPEGEWYDQKADEWVALLKGRALLQFENDVLELNAGEYILIPASVKHRVSSVSKDGVWLALHMD